MTPPPSLLAPYIAPAHPAQCDTAAAHLAAAHAHLVSAERFFGEESPARMEECHAVLGAATVLVETLRLNDIRRVVEES